MTKTAAAAADAISPYGGGALVDRHADDAAAAELDEQHRAGTLVTLSLDTRQQSDLELIANGTFTPLGGFMGRADYERVVGEGRLAGGLPWTIPITLSARAEVAEKLGGGQTIGLTDAAGQLAGALRVSEVFAYDKEREAARVYGTTDRAHPAVAYLMGEAGDRLVGGEALLLRRSPHPFPDHDLGPAALRAIFRGRGWKRVVAFQTRNPIHRAHEFLTKCALEVCDGLLVHPIVGFTKEDDVPADVRMRCYEAVLAGYYPRDRAVLATLPAAMRYAGPKEAIFHAIMRRNCGCTHFIVGRDHAGVGNYYGTYDAQRIFDEYDPAELGITPLRFEHAVFCKACGGMATPKSCPHDKSSHVFLSGTKVRELLVSGQRPPAELSRPEVADILIAAYRN